MQFPNTNFDPVADRAERTLGARLILGRPAERCAHPGDDLLEPFAEKALIGKDSVAVSRARCSISAATTRSETLAAASSKAIGIPFGAHSSYSRTRPRAMSSASGSVADGPVS